MNSLIHVAGAQIGWFACVLGAANQMPWLGVIVALVIVAVHLVRAINRELETKLIVVSLPIGLALDSSLASAGLIAFPSGTIVEGFTTPWMLGLWATFATALTTTLRQIVTRTGPAFAFGAIGGPLAYGAGAKLGAISLSDSLLTFPSIALGWALAMGLFSLTITKSPDKTLRETVA